MILINLLPYREERRKRRKAAFFAGLGVAALAGAGIVSAIYLLLQFLTTEQQAHNQYIQNEISRLEAQIKDIANLKTEIESLKARQRAVEDLQTDRNMPVHILNELARQTPEGIYLKTIKQEGQFVTVTGVAQTNERVSAFLRNTGNNSPWLERPELQEIKAASVVLPDTKDPKRLFEFSMRVGLKRPQDANAAAGGASAPARGAAVGASAPSPV